MFFSEIHIENTNSCGYKCVMCPRDLHTRKIGFMPVEDFALVLERVGAWDPHFKGNFHLHGFGEALLDRKFIEKVALLKRVFPKARAQIFSTLGVRVKEDYFAQLRKAGLDDIIVSLYGFTEESYARVHGFSGFSLVKHNLSLLSRENAGIATCIKIPGPQVHSSLPCLEEGERASFCAWVESLGFEVKQWPYVHNFGSGRSYNPPGQGKLCPVIGGKRKEILNVTWNLDVIPCCYDFNATICLGSLREQSLEEIFSSPTYFHFVLRQQTEDLSEYPVCQNCEKHDVS